MISAEDLGGLLSCIHTHAGMLAVWEGEQEDHVRNPDEIIYKEADIIKLLVKLGFPEPVWGKSINIDKYDINKGDNSGE